jgi:hypothetical protein
VQRCSAGLRACGFTELSNPMLHWRCVEVFKCALFFSPVTNSVKIFSTKPVVTCHSSTRMRLGAQTGTPLGVHEKSAVNLRQTAFYRHSLGRKAHPAAHVFRSQALTDGSKPALYFPGKPDARLRHASDNAAYCRLTPLPAENFHLFSPFYTYLHINVIALIFWGAHASGVPCSASRRTPRTTDFLFINEGSQISCWSRSRPGSDGTPEACAPHSEVQTLWSGSEINQQLCENM